MNIPRKRVIQMLAAGLGILLGIGIAAPYVTVDQYAKRLLWLGLDGLKLRPPSKHPPRRVLLSGQEPPRTSCVLS